MPRDDEPGLPPTIDAATVRRMATLARLALSDDEVARAAVDLGRIVAHVASLAEVTFDAHAARTVDLGREQMPLRPDEPAPSLPREVVLAQAPQAHDGGFAVPTFVDEG